MRANREGSTMCEHFNEPHECVACAEKRRLECAHGNLQSFGCEDCFAGPEEVQADLARRRTTLTGH